MDLKAIASVFKESGDIAIIPHISADGDAIGSSLALALAFERLGARARVYLEEAVPLLYRFLPGERLITVYEEETEGTSHELAVALDTGDISRLGKRSVIFSKAGKTINIDHHSTNSNFARLNYVDTASSAVGEIIYRLLKMMGLFLTPDISACLYTAIATDTGGFRYSNTTSLTHQITAELVKNGADVAELSQKLFETTTLGKVRLLGTAAQSLELLDNGRISLITVTDDMLKESRAIEEDCEGIVNLGRNIRNVQIALMMRLYDNGEIKVNLRSNTGVNVARIANSFSGGGHNKAAGFTAAGDAGNLRLRLLEEVRKAMERDGV